MRNKISVIVLGLLALVLVGGVVGGCGQGGGTEVSEVTPTTLPVTTTTTVVTSTSTTTTLMPASSRPELVSGFIAIGGEGQVTLTWEANTEDDIAGYKLYRACRVKGEAYALIATVSGEVLSYIDTGLTNDTTYFYEIKAFNKGGIESYGAGLYVTPNDTTPPTILRMDLFPKVLNKETNVATLEIIVSEPGKAGVVKQRMTASSLYEIDGTSWYYPFQYNSTPVGDGTHKISYIFDFSDGTDSDDGFWKVSARVKDAGGLLSEQPVIEGFRIDQQNPDIYGTSCSPMVLRDDRSVTFSYTISESDDDDDNKNLGLITTVEVYSNNDIFSDRDNDDILIRSWTNTSVLPGRYSVSWSDNDPLNSVAIEDGSYVFKVYATDFAGNMDWGYFSCIKNGIPPFISAPIENQIVSGVFTIRGTAGDHDWWNSINMEKYRIYYASGTIPSLPVDFIDLDSDIWKFDCLATPSSYRVDGTPLNTGLLPVQYNILATIDTTLLVNGDYTLLLITDEQAGGTSAGFLRRIIVNN